MFNNPKLKKISLALTNDVYQIKPVNVTKVKITH